MNNQRWRDRHSSSRPADEPIRTQDYEVASIDDDNTAKLPYPKLHQEAA